MKKFVPLGIAFALLLATIVSPSGTAEAQNAGLVSSLLSRMERNQRSLKSLRANISMEKYNAQLHDKDNYQGVIAYIPGSGRSAWVKLEWTSPQHEILAIANNGYQLYRPRLNTVIEGTTRSVRDKKDNDVLRLMSMNAAQFRNEFGPFEDLAETTLWGGVHTTHFKVVPKGAASYRHIEVWVDDNGMPVQTKMVEKNDDSTTVRLTDIAKNASIPLDEFTLKLDPSVKRIKG
jgi:outer membrane lipoprotein-sorting protein